MTDDSIKQYQRALAEQLPRAGSRIRLQVDVRPVLDITSAAVAREIITATRQIIAAHIVQQINSNAGGLALTQTSAATDTSNHTPDGGQFWPQRR